MLVFSKLPLLFFSKARQSSEMSSPPWLKGLLVDELPFPALSICFQFRDYNYILSIRHPSLKCPQTAYNTALSPFPSLQVPHLGFPVSLNTTITNSSFWIPQKSLTKAILLSQESPNISTPCNSPAINVLLITVHLPGLILVTTTERVFQSQCYPL